MVGSLGPKNGSANAFAADAVEQTKRPDEFVELVALDGITLKTYSKEIKCRLFAQSGKAATSMTCL